MQRLFVISCALSLTSALLTNIDFSQPATQSQLNGLKNDGYTAACVRAYSPTGNFDKNACHSIKYALNAGLASMIYVTPVPKKVDAPTLVQDLYTGLMACGFTYHHWWLQVVRKENWNDNVADNVQYIKDIVAIAKTLQQTVGIYTSAQEWKDIVGDYDINGADNKGEKHALWYWSNSTTEDFNDFVPFSGWKAPTMKQFRQSVVVEGISGNKNVYASNFR